MSLVETFYVEAHYRDMKPLLIGLLLTSAAFCGEFRSHLVGSMLDVYVSYSTEKPADIPDAGPERNHIIVSVKTTDDYAQAVMVWVMVRLDDQTRTTRTAVLQRKPGENRLVFRLPLGERRPIELIDIRVDNLRKTFLDVLAPA